MQGADPSRVILVVEDDRDLRDSLAEILLDHGYHPLPAANGREALELLRGPEPRPRLILLDIMMPVMDGWEFRIEQCKDAELSAIPVVVLSAHTNVAETAEQMKAAGHLKKPVRLDTLLEVVARFCQPPAPA